MIERKKELAELDGLLQRHRVVGMIGARQVGKSTLVEEYLKTVSVPSYPKRENEIIAMLL